jgi:hypothetical protein
MSKKNRKNKNYQGPKLPQRPEYFRDFAECISWLKKCVFMVVRGRKIELEGKESINWITLGTGFIAAPNRFITANHVINDPDENKGEGYRHKDGDKYFILKHDDENNTYGRILDLNLNENIFLYPDIDLAIIYLEEIFYKEGDTVFIDKNDFIRISKSFVPIGTDIGVLGYPLSNLTFMDQDFTRPNIGDILLRTDTGVVNCRYQMPDKTFAYEFTLAFNPGNSGGPIFDIKTGRLLSIVKGYKAIQISAKENIISDEASKQLKTYKEKAFIEVLHATYSVGNATPSFVEIFQIHNIIN